MQDDGNWKIDARLALRTDDGESVFCYYSGVVVMDDDLNARFGAGYVFISQNNFNFNITYDFLVNKNMNGMRKGRLTLGISTDIKLIAK